MSLLLSLLTSISLCVQEDKGAEKVGQAVAFPVLLLSIQHGDQTRLGYLLKGDPSRAHLVAITADAELLDLPAEEVTSCTPAARHDVAQIPSAALVAALAHADKFVADQAMMLLRCQGSKAMPVILAALKSPAAGARWRALRLYSYAPEKKSAGRVRSCLQDEDPKVRRSALRAYAATGLPDCWNACLRALTFEKDLHIRHDAIELLGHSNYPEALEALIDEAGRADERSLKIAAFAALRRLTGLRLGRDASKWQAWWRNHGPEWVRTKSEELEQEAAR